MDDQSLKELLRKDQSCPQKNRGEWAQILTKIETPPSFWSRGNLIAACVSLVLVFSVFQIWKTSSEGLSQQERIEILSYYTDSNYFESIEESYPIVADL